jgi:hypothetical protein
MHFFLPKPVPTGTSFTINSCNKICVSDEATMNFYPTYFIQSMNMDLVPVPVIFLLC